MKNRFEKKKQSKNEHTNGEKKTIDRKKIKTNKNSLRNMLTVQLFYKANDHKRDVKKREKKTPENGIKNLRYKKIIRQKLVHEWIETKSKQMYDNNKNIHTKHRENFELYTQNMKQ